MPLVAERLVTALAAGLLTPSLLTGCSVLSGERAPLNVSNGTTLEVTLVVNGRAVATFGPGKGTPDDGFAGPLPPRRGPSP